MIKKIVRYLRNKSRFSLEKLIMKFGIKKGLLLHVGANLGQEADTYDRLNFERVVWIEGYPQFSEKLEEVLKGRDNHTLITALLTRSTGEKINFNITSNLGSSTALELTDDWKKLHPSISVNSVSSISGKRFSDLFDEELNSFKSTAISLMVLDIEGSELIALEGMDQYINNVEFALIEFSTAKNFVGGPQISDIDRFMMNNQFKRVWKKMGVVSGDALYKRVDILHKHERLLTLLSAYFLIVVTRLKITNIIRLMKNKVKTYE